jgi:NADH-quinone oxidoreductase subunit N
VLSFLIITVGISFKIAAAPFHMWAPDVYQGAPTPVTAFLSVVSKTAGFVLLIRLLLSVFGNASTAGQGSIPILLDMQNYLVVIAGATMIIGNLVALRQRNIKRMFAYSSIAHAGYILVAVSALSVFMFDSMWFYLLAYLFMNMGAFAVIQLLTEKAGSEDISHFAGLYRRSPLLAIAMSVMILSLAGIPGTAGFIGKLNIITGAAVVPEPHYVLIAVMIATTVISYVYYFGVMVQMFFRPAETMEKVKIPAGVGIVLAVCVIATIWFGVLPNTAFDFLQNNFYEFSDFMQ